MKNIKIKGVTSHMILVLRSHKIMIFIMNISIGIKEKHTDITLCIYMELSGKENV